MDNSTQFVFTNHPCFDRIVRLCLQYMTASDMKNLRLASKKFNNIIMDNPKFNCNEKRKTILNGSFRKCHNWYNVNQAMPWYNIYMKNYIESGSGGLMKQLWPIMGRTVTKMGMKDIKISCENMCLLLNNAPVLRDVDFESIRFNHDINDEKGNMPIVYCTHVLPEQRESEKYAQLTQTNVPSPTIKKVCFFTQPGIPLCLLDNLITRTKGNLVDLSIQNSVCLSKVQTKTTRTENFEVVEFDVTAFIIKYATFVLRHSELVCPRILQLMRGSISSLTRLEFRNNYGFGFINYLANNITQDEFQIRELVLETSILEAMDEEETVPAPDPEQANLVQLLRILSPSSVEKLTIGFEYRVGETLIPRMILPLRNLVTLKIKTFWIDIFDELRFRILNPTVKNLSICPWSRYPVIEFGEKFFEDLEQIHLEQFSTSIMFDFQQENQVHRVFHSPRFSGLRKLRFWDGVNVTNYVVQTVISACTLLEELQIHESTKLDDCGITGLNNDLLDSVRSSKNFGLLDSSEEQQEQNGHQLNKLTHLRILSFKDCKGITDLSFYYALKFTKLSVLDLSGCEKVTNTVMSRLGQNNPSMKTLTIHRASGITAEGINAFISANRSIQVIEVTKIPKISKPKPNRNGVPLNINFYDIVKATKEVKNYC